MADTDNSGFGKFVPGFEFLQNLARQATSGLAQGMQPGAPQLPSLGHWVAPTFNVEELDRRIQELKTVHFWLEQNARALATTIQALEVQKMTLATLQGMNVSMGDVANALKVNTADTMASMAELAMKGMKVPEAAPAPSEPPAAQPPADEPVKASASEAPAAAPVVDPMQWWGALTQQFQTIASQAMQDLPGQTAVVMGKQMASALATEAVKTATEMTAGVARTLSASGEAAAAAPTTARKKAATAGSGRAAAAPAKAAPRRSKAAAPAARGRAAASGTRRQKPGSLSRWHMPPIPIGGWRQRLCWRSSGRRPACCPAWPSCTSQTISPRMRRPCWTS